MYSRRDFGKLALAAFPAASALSAINSTIHGVRIGAQTYSFRDMPLEDAIDAMKQIGLGECELFSEHVEPKNLKGAAMKEWRLATPISYFHDVRQKFDTAGIKIFAYTLNFKKEMSEEEMERVFPQTLALGTKIITTSATLPVAERIAPLAAKYKVIVGLHGHDQVDKPEEFSTPESFAKGLAFSPWYRINLDIGHFVSAGFDPVSYIQEHHEKIICLHLKDRTKAHQNLPFGEGETPIKQVLQLLRDKKYKMPANIEYEYGKKGMDTVAEVRKCFEFCKQALA